MAGVVADAGPLIALAKLNLLHLLKALFGQVSFAAAVYDEVVVEGLAGGFEDAKTLQRFLSQEGWTAMPAAGVAETLRDAALDRGERASLALALAQDALLLIDEERGREVAAGLGIRVRGTLGVLIDAYRSGLITADQLRFYFGQIEERNDIWISPSLCNLLLKQVLG